MRKRETVVFEPEWLDDNRLKWPARVLLAKIAKLSNYGEKELTFTRCNGYFFDMLNITPDEIRTAWNQLKDSGYIRKTVIKEKGNETVIRFLSTKGNQIDAPSRENPDTPLGESPKPSRENPDSLSGNTRDTLGESPKPSRGIPDSSSSLSSNQSINQSGDPSIYSPTAPTPYPHTYEEVIPLFRDYVARHKAECPALANMPVSMEAERFFLYWNDEQQWTRGREKVKSVESLVATWCSNWGARQRPGRMPNRPRADAERSAERAREMALELGMPTKDQQGPIDVEAETVTTEFLTTNGGNS